MLRITPCFILILVIFLTQGDRVYSQTTQLPVKDWVKKLSDHTDKKNQWYNDLFPVLDKLDSAAVFNFMNQLGHNAGTKGDYFIARYNCILSHALYHKNLAAPDTFVFANDPAKNRIIGLLEEAKQKSYECNDDYLAAFVSGFYGNYMSVFGHTEAAVMYMMNSAELYEKVNLSADFKIYVVLGEMLWRVREYEKCIKYTHKALDILKTMDNKVKDVFTIFCSNTLALAFHRMAQYDSAFVYYKQGLAAAEKINNTAWVGIISGNMAQIYYAQGKYTTALPLFELDYATSNEQGYYDNAANSLQWAARTNLALGKSGIALAQVRETFSLLQKWPAAGYLQNAYLAAAEIFKTLNNDDSSLYYSAQYNKLHDSLEKVIYQSSVSISKLRLSDEKNRYNILNLQREKKLQLQQRNLIIAAIAFLAAVVLLLINRQRLKLKHRQQIAEQEKLRIEQEMESAGEQLKMFTQSIIEKTNLIEQLEQQVQYKTNSAENQQLITELGNQTILTEDDWSRFKSLFEKIFPLFFQRLKQVAADITLAEQRVAALTRLQLTTKQMAAVLGISPNSVNKTRQRLRQRFNMEEEQNIEKFISEI